MLIPWSFYDEHWSCSHFAVLILISKYCRTSAQTSMYLTFHQRAFECLPLFWCIVYERLVMIDKVRLLCCTGEFLRLLQLIKEWNCITFTFLLCSGEGLSSCQHIIFIWFFISYFTKITYTNVFIYHIYISLFSSNIFINLHYNFLIAEEEMHSTLGNIKNNCFFRVWFIYYVCFADYSIRECNIRALLSFLSWEDWTRISTLINEINTYKATIFIGTNK